MSRFVVLAAVAIGLAGAAEATTLEELLRRVATEQDRAVEARKRYIYEQQIQARIFNGGGKKLRHELIRRFEVTPSSEGVQRERVDEIRRTRADNEMRPFREDDKLGWDGDLADSMADDLILGNSRDGLEERAFPLTSAMQELFVFQLDGEEQYRGAEVYKLLFKPKPHGSSPWQGEALIHAEAFQPVLMICNLAAEIPVWVQWTFGINIRQLGFKVAYQEFEPGVWFPSTLGGEAEIRLFHLYKRKASTSLVNSDFRRATVNSEIQFSP